MGYRYSVILRSDIPASERELLATLCAEITTKTGPALLEFRCTKIDVSHHNYIEMETLPRHGEVTWPLRVFYYYVFLISGDEQGNRIGF